MDFTDTSTRSYECTTCPDGYFNKDVDGSTTLHTDANSECDAYQNCPNGEGVSVDGTTTSDVTCADCVVGMFSDVNTVTACKICGTAKYQDQVGESSCIAGCASAGGYYADASAVVADHVSDSALGCVACVAGKFTTGSGFSTCTYCGSGKIQADAGEAACVACGAGKYAPDAVTTGDPPTQACTNCGHGKYNSVATGIIESECTYCEAGRKQPLAGKLLCDKCLEGQYAPDAVVSPNTPLAAVNQVCKDCGHGKYNDLNTGIVETGCKHCAAGQKQPDAGQPDCDPCAQGKYSPIAKTPSTSSVSPLASSEQVCTPCQIGKYNGVATGVESCTFCTGGQKQPLEDQIECDICAEGKYSPDALSVGDDLRTAAEEVCKLCQIGKFIGAVSGVAYTGVESCKFCVAGQKQPLEGQTECDICKVGRYSPNELSGDDDLRTAAQEVCKTCPVGKYQSQSTVGVEKSGCKKCMYATYSADPDAGLACTNCPVGRYITTHTGEELDLHDEADDCLACPGGFKAAAVATTVCNKCASGRVQPDDGEDDCIDCPVGRHSKTSTTFPKICRPCPAGYIQKEVNEITCTVCDKGQYADLNNMILCKKCVQGKYLDGAGAAVADVDGDNGDTSRDAEADCKDCEAGKFSTVAMMLKSGATGASVDSGIAWCKVCPKGWYQHLVQKTECIKCVTGKYNNKLPSTSGTAHESSAGTQSQSTGHDTESDCKQCEVGKFKNIEKATSCEKCPGGYYQDLGFEGLLSVSDAGRGQTSCKECPVGYWLLNSHTSKDDHDQHSDCKACRAGQYNPQNAQWNCKLCAAPKYQGDVAQTSCESCPAGRYLLKTDSQCEDEIMPDYYGSVAPTFGITPVPQPFYDTKWRCWATASASGTKRDSDGVWDDADHTIGNREVYDYKRVKTQNLLSLMGDRGRDKLEACLFCERGMYFIGQLQECRICPKGWIQTSLNTADAQCEECPAGKHNRYEDGGFNGGSAGAHGLSATDKEKSYDIADRDGINKYANNGRKEDHDNVNDCKDCPAGYHSLTGYPKCIGCPAGFYQDRDGQPTIAGAEPCPACAAGKFSPGSGSGCKICGKGSFNDESKQAGCKHCGHGKFLDVGGSDATKHVAPTSCKVCPRGRFNDLRQLKGCAQKFQTSQVSNNAYTSDTIPKGSGILSGNWRCNLGDVPECVMDVDPALSTCMMGAPLVGTHVEATKASYRSLSKLRGAVKHKLGFYSYVGSPVSTNAAEFFCRAMRRDWEYATALKSTLAAPPSTAITDPKHVLFTNRRFGRKDGGGPWAPNGGQSDLADGRVIMYNVEAGRAHCGGATPQEACSNFNFASGNIGAKQTCTENKCNIFTKNKACNPGCCENNAGNGCADGTTFNGAPLQIKPRMDIVCGACYSGLFYLNEPGDETHGYCDDYFQYRDGAGLDEDCWHCPSGWYQDIEGSNDCKKCAVGKHRVAKTATAEQDCVVCEIGKYTEHKGQVYCKDCPKGRYNPVTQSVALIACTRCELGKYNDEQGMSSEGAACKSCPKGRIANIDSIRLEDYGAFSVPGTFTYASNTGGHVGIISWEECAICKRGRYMDQEAQVRVPPTEGGRCKLCPAGSWRSLQGGTRPDHFVGDEDGPLGKDLTTNLYPWATGKDNPGVTIDARYQIVGSSRLGYDGCLSCTRGRYSNPGSADSKADGQESDDVAIKNLDCPVCPKGWYGHESRVSACTRCETGKYQDETDIPTRAYVPKTQVCTIPSSTVYSGQYIIQGSSSGWIGKDETTTSLKIYLKNGQTFPLSGGQLTIQSHSGYLDWYADNQGRTLPQKPINDVFGGQFPFKDHTVTATSCTAAIDPDLLYARLKVDNSQDRHKDWNSIRRENNDASNTIDNSVYKNYECKTCPLGRYLPLLTSVKVEDCKSCPKGKYGDEYGVKSYTKCKLCPSGRYGTFEGMTRVQSILDSLYNNAGGCLVCRELIFFVLNDFFVLYSPDATYYLDPTAASIM